MVETSKEEEEEETLDKIFVGRIRYGSKTVLGAGSDKAWDLDRQCYSRR